jgi:hypothetical protein
MSHRLRRAFAVPLALLALFAASSCTSRGDAEEALRQAEAAITAQHAEALRYAPEAFTEVMRSYTAARQSLDSGDYRAAARNADGAAALARSLPAAIAAGREALGPRWGEVHGNLSLLISSLEKRLGEVDRAGRRPAGVTAAQVIEARAALDTLRVGLRRAAGAWDQGDRTEAIHAAERLQPRGLAALELLGVRMGPHGAR